MSTPPIPFLDQPPDNVSVKDITSTEIDPTAAAFLAALGIVKSGVIEKFFGVRAAAMIDSATTITAILTGNWDKMMSMVGKLFLAAQGEQNSSFYDLAAAVVEDLTGTKVDAAQLKQSTFGSGRLAGMDTLGADVYDLLQKEFAPASGNLEEGSADPAKTFLGFLMNFCIRQGNVAAMCEAMPKELGFLSGFRDYGEQMAKNLGLGRLARRALQPLMQILVADPLMYQLQEQYRPKRIGATPAIKKFFRDSTFEQQMRKELAQEGFTDTRIDDLIAELRPLLPDRDVIHHAFRFGIVSSSVGSGNAPGLTDLLQQRGFTADQAQQLIDVERPTLDKAEIATLFSNSLMDQPTALSYLSKLGYTDDDAQLVLRAHSLQHHHARTIGLAGLRKAFHDNVIDLLELRTHLSAQGYSDDDIQIITLDLLQPPTGKVRQLSLAEIKAGYKAGVLTQQQAHDHLRTLGYSDSDIAVIIATLPVKATATTATTPASPATGTPPAG